MLDNEQLNRCPHLCHTPLPPPGVDRPSDSTLWSHRNSYEQALARGSERQLAKWRKAFGETLWLHGMPIEANKVDPPHSSSGRGASTQTVPMEVDQRRSGARATAINSRPVQHGSASTNQSTPTPQPARQLDKGNEQVEVVYTRGGDDALPPSGQTVSWEDQMLVEEGETQEEAGWTSVHSKNSKRTRDPSNDRQQQQVWLHKDTWSPQPFPLWRHEERAAAVLKLFKAAGQLKEAPWDWIKNIVMDRYPRKSNEEIIYIANVIMAMISKFHLTSSCLARGYCWIIIAAFIEDDLPPEEEYLTKEESGTRDIWVLNHAALLRVAVWLQRFKTITNFGEDGNRSLLKEEHVISNLVCFLMDIGMCPFSEDDVLAQVLAENIEDTLQHYSIAEHAHESALHTHDGLAEKVRNAEEAYANIPVGNRSKQGKADELLRLKNQMEWALTMVEQHRDTMHSLQIRLHEIRKWKWNWNLQVKPPKMRIHPVPTLKIWRWMNRRMIN